MEQEGGAVGIVPMVPWPWRAAVCPARGRAAFRHLGNIGQNADGSRWSASGYLQVRCAPVSGNRLHMFFLQADDSLFKNERNSQ